MKKIYIRSEAIELFKILKFEGLVASGGEAKMVIAEGLVQVNDQIETQKRKKINSWDEISFNNETFLVARESAD